MTHTRGFSVNGRPYRASALADRDTAPGIPGYATGGLSYGHGCLRQEPDWRTRYIFPQQCLVVASLGRGRSGELAYQFTPGGYVMSVLNALYAVEQIYLAGQRDHDTAGEREHEKLARHDAKRTRRNPGIDGELE